MRLRKDAIVRLMVPKQSTLDSKDSFSGIYSCQGDPQVLPASNHGSNGPLKRFIGHSGNWAQ